MAREWGLIIGFVALVLTFMVGLARRREQQISRASGIAIGVVCGLVAAFVIIQPRIDVVPDRLEPMGVAVLVVIVSLGLIVLTWRGWTRN